MIVYETCIRILRRVCLARWVAAGVIFATFGYKAGAAVNVYDQIGRRVWVNECAGSEQGLVTWNVGENFPSMGIGHFIWYPAGVRGAFEESFPKFVQFAQVAGVSVPAFFRGPAPWRTRAAFLTDKSGRTAAMRRWLAAHVDIQTQFLAARSRASLGKMLRVAGEPQDVRAKFDALSRTPQGLYCLVDYVNFKGEGIDPRERYAGQGWGLLQVLEAMQPVDARTAPAEFARAAERVIRRRVRNAPPARNEQRWLAGWINRCHSYMPKRGN